MEYFNQVMELKELTTAIKQLSVGCSPAIDRLPAELYKYFWDSLPPSCTRAVLPLLPKKQILGFYQTGYLFPYFALITKKKILSKCLSNWLKEHMDTVIHVNQSYCITEHLIMDKLFMPRVSIELSELTAQDLVLLSNEQEEAFERIDYLYLFRTFRAFGFGDSFIALIKLLYKQITIILKVAGGLRYPLAVHRGIRQGSSIWGQLYSLAIEGLLSRLRTESKGLVVQGSPALMLSADDVTVFIKGKKTFKH